MADEINITAEPVAKAAPAGDKAAPPDNRTAPPESATAMPDNQAVPPDSPPTPAPAAARAKRRRLLLVALPLIALLAAYGGHWYIWSLSHVRTDDAQADGHIHGVASKVAGYVAEVDVDDNQQVAAGDVLVRIRSEDYESQVQLAEANVSQAQADAKVAEHNLAVLRGTTAATIAQAEAGVREDEARLEAARKDADSAQSKLTAATAARDQAQAQAEAAQADFDYATYNRNRVKSLHERHEAAEDELQLAESRYRAAQGALAAANEAVKLTAAQIQAAQHELAASQAAIGVAQAALEKQRGVLADAQTGPDQVRVAEARLALAQAGVAARQAQLALARQALNDCTIIAPADGMISKRSVEVGQYLQPGQPFLAIVPLDDTWVVANYKETQLRNMRAGQPAELDVDAYPGHPFRGHVESIAAGTGARFSLLPPENATGNYVKVVQRVPVKIVLDPSARDPQRPLRPGMNVVVTVNTSETPAPPTPRP